MLSQYISPSVFEPLRYIFNLSIEKGIFPDQLKIAKVTPLFKKGDNVLMDNYCPIAVLPCFSKILGRIIYNRTFITVFYIKSNLVFRNNIQLTMR